MDPLQKEMGDLVVQDIKKAEVLNNISASVFTSTFSVAPPVSQKAKAGTGKMRDYLL